MSLHSAPGADASQRAVAFIDPYWLVGRSIEPSSATVQSLHRALPSGVTLARTYWYVESDGAVPAPGPMAHVSLRIAARDDLDDGYELLRAMEGDIRAAVASGAYDALVIASHDDRLALTIEWAKAQGCAVLGCATEADEPDPRIQRLVDEMISLRVGGRHREESDAPPTADALDVIAAVIAQWHAEAGADDVDATRRYVERRPGLPRPVDSRLLFLGRSKLGRELTQGERVALRRAFRESMPAAIPTGAA